MESWRKEFYLLHHGIKGQKWGQQNGPPYPLDYNKHSLVEKKLNSKSLLANENKEQNLDKRKGLTSGQKKAIIIGATAAAAALAVCGGIYLAKTGKLDNIVGIGKNSINSILGTGSSIKDPITGFQKAVDNYSFNEKLDRCNPAYKGPLYLFLHPTEIGFNMNCGNSVIAMEGQMKGLDVMAKYNSNGMTIANIGQFFEGLSSDSFINPQIDVPELPKASKITDFFKWNKLAESRGKIVEKSLLESIKSSYPDGARGAMFVPGRRIDGTFASHWIYWTKNDGQAKLSNPQHRKLNLTRFLGTITYHKNMMDAQVTGIRLDNANFNLKHINDAIVDYNKRGAPVIDLFDPAKAIGENFVINDLF